MVRSQQAQIEIVLMKLFNVHVGLMKLYYGARWSYKLLMKIMLAEIEVRLMAVILA